MKILADCHVHTNNSFDAESSLISICENALSKGIGIISVTDHMEAPEIPLGRNSQYGDMMKQIKKSAEDVDECRSEFQGKIQLIKGIELGEPMHNPECTKMALGIDNFDFILGSVHNLRDHEDFYFMEYNDENVPVLLDLYFKELLDTAQNADFDSLSHLTYPLRYIVERTGKIPDLSCFSEIIDEIFTTLIRRNKALEINTSGLFKPIGTTMPDENLLIRYKELGGKYITIGSDSHSAETIGAGIKKGVEVARKSGFNYYNYFMNREPYFIKI